MVGGAAVFVPTAPGAPRGICLPFLLPMIRRTLAEMTSATKMRAVLLSVVAGIAAAALFVVPAMALGPGACGLFGWGIVHWWDAVAIALGTAIGQWIGLRRASGTADALFATGVILVLAYGAVVAINTVIGIFASGFTVWMGLGKLFFAVWFTIWWVFPLILGAEAVGFAVLRRVSSRARACNQTHGA